MRSEASGMIRRPPVRLSRAEHDENAGHGEEPGPRPRDQDPADQGDRNDLPTQERRQGLALFRNPQSELTQEEEEDSSEEGPEDRLPFLHGRDGAPEAVARDGAEDPPAEPQEEGRMKDRDPDEPLRSRARCFHLPS